MELLFYPYDFDYKVEDQTYLLLYSKLKNGKKIVVKHPCQPYFYVSLEKVDQEQLQQKLNDLIVETAKVVGYEETEKELIGKKLKLLKVFTNYPNAVPIIAKRLKELGVDCYEKDIIFIHRYLRDNKIVPFSLTKAEGEYFGLLKELPLFLAKKIVPEDFGFESSLNDWNILAIDIETYSKKKEINYHTNPILMVALYGKGFKKVITWKNFENDLDYLEVVENEAELLKRFKEIILEQQPELIAGYFSDGFDFPYLKARAEKHKIILNLGLDGSELIVRKSDVKINGIIHLDVFKFIRNIIGKNLKTDNLSLNAVSLELLGNQKHEINLSDLSYIWDYEPEKLVDFCKYNLQDADLTYQLSEKLFSDVVEFTKIMGLPTFDVIRMSFSKLVENYILKRAIDENVLAPNRPGNEEISQRMEESIQGAFVYQPIPGLYKDIVVFDFRSLYPTIITSHNIGPESFRCSCCKDKALVPEREQYWFCQKEKKFIPSLLEDIISKRVNLKKIIKEKKKNKEDVVVLEARSYALKILANSFYGYLGFYAARWYCLECAASTTAYARNYIKTTIEKAENKGFEVIYADTDSCFLLLGNQSLKDTQNFMEEINFSLPGNMELEFEGYFKSGIFVAQKGSKLGAKKKYALLTDKGEIKITGFEAVRRNWSKFAKEVQREVLDLVLKGKVNEALDYVKGMVNKLKTGKVKLDKLILKTQITRELSQYSSIGPHVKVAKDLVASGEEIGPGVVVEYVIEKGSGLVREKAKIPEEVSNYDADYYLKHQLIPVVSSIFAVLGYSEDEIFTESRQTGLGGFFKVL